MTNEDLYEKEQRQKEKALQRCIELCKRMQSAIEYLDGRTKEFENANEAFGIIDECFKELGEIVAANRPTDAAVVDKDESSLIPNMIKGTRLACPVALETAMAEAFDDGLWDAALHALDVSRDKSKLAETREAHKQLFMWLCDVKYRKNADDIIKRWIAPDKNDYDKLAAEVQSLGADLKDPNHEWACDACKQDHEKIYGWLVWLKHEWAAELNIKD